MPSEFGVNSFFAQKPRNTKSGRTTSTASTLQRRNGLGGLLEHEADFAVAAQEAQTVIAPISDQLQRAHVQTGGDAVAGASGAEFFDGCDQSAVRGLARHPEPHR